MVQHQTAGQQHGRGVGDVLVCDALPRVSGRLKYSRVMSATKDNDDGSGPGVLTFHF